MIDQEILQLAKNIELLGLKKYGIMEWASPIVFFGNLEKSKIATVGINPSNKEFEDGAKNELLREKRRFPTLNSFLIEKWSEITMVEVEAIRKAYRDYFVMSPYDTWFKRLDYILSKSGNSYYFPALDVCHVDLIPYATYEKWGDLSAEKKMKLKQVSVNSIRKIIKYSKLELLILNGKTVIEMMSDLFNLKYRMEHDESIDLPRKSGNHIRGYFYFSELPFLNSEGRKIHVIGYNHNIQSSYGVTKEVLNNIRDKISISMQNE